MRFFLKIIPALVCWSFFIYTILQVPYPETITQANTYQILLFFATLFFALIFTLNIFLQNIIISVFISLGVIFLLSLKALDSLNIITALLVIFSVGLFTSYFRKKKRSLTNSSKIPKLTKLRKQ